MSAPTAADAAGAAVRPHASDVRFVLVTEADVSRAAWCLEALQPFGLGALVARDADEAIAVMRNFGAPVLLLTALSLPGAGGGFVVMRVLRTVAGPRSAAIIALTGVGDAPFSSGARTALGINAVLPHTASAGALRDAIADALATTGTIVPAPPGERMPDHDVVDRMLRDVVEQATNLTGVPGAAVYVKTAPHGRFRAHVNWIMHDADPRSPFSLPYVFERILETGEPLVFPDLTPQPAEAVQRGSIDEVIRGLAAAPLIGREGRVLGTICVFDVKPLSAAVDVDALLALGRRVGPMLEAVAPARMDLSASNGHDATARNDGGAPPAAPETDDVTGLPTRGAGCGIIAIEIARAHDQHLPLSLLLLRIDDFAAIEERSDRPLVDRVLRTVGRMVTGALRRTDSAIRWNAAEFLVVLPEIGLDTARAVADRIRTAALGRSSRGLPAVTVSGGATEVPPGGTFEEALRRLDDLVAEAGKSGGNRIS